MPTNFIWNTAGLWDEGEVPETTATITNVDTENRVVTLTTANTNDPWAFQTIANTGIDWERYRMDWNAAAFAHPIVYGGLELAPSKPKVKKIKRNLPDWW